MATYIPPDFTPNPDTINRLRKKGIFPDFLEAAVDDAFRCYWNEQKEKKLAAGKKSSWQTTYFNWAIRAHQGKVGMEYERDRHRRESHGKAYKGDLFAEALENRTDLQWPKELQDEFKKKKAKPLEFNKIPKPKPRQVASGGPPMTAEAAFEELRKMKII